MPITIMLVDNNPAFLRVLARFLAESGEGDLEVVGSVVGGREAVAEAERLRPDVVLVDLAMEDLPGLLLLPRLRQAMPGTALIALSLLDPEDCRRAAEEAGAQAFVSKGSLDRELIPTIRRLASPAAGCAASAVRWAR